jgi:hypothetical protein
MQHGSSPFFGTNYGSFCHMASPAASIVLLPKQTVQLGADGQHEGAAKRLAVMNGIEGWIRCSGAPEIDEPVLFARRKERGVAADLKHQPVTSLQQLREWKQAEAGGEQDTCKRT